MQISVPLNDHQLLDDRFGKYATEMISDHPVRSFPITITDAPANTQAFALSFIDYDAVPVSGFAWIHWLATDIPGDWHTIPENASQELAGQFIQGNNSNAGGLVNGNPNITTGYVGPQPPDQTHHYTLVVYALDQPLKLTPGFWYNEFRRAVADHTLAQATLELPSRA